MPGHFFTTAHCATACSSSRTCPATAISSPLPDPRPRHNWIDRGDLQPGIGLLNDDVARRQGPAQALLLPRRAASRQAAGAQEATRVNGVLGFPHERDRESSSIRTQQPLRWSS